MDATSAHLAPCFSFGRWQALPAAERDVARVQRFFEANSEYFLLCDGRMPGAAEGREFVLDAPPASWSYRAHLNLLLLGPEHEVHGVAAVAIDLGAPGVWHLGLFIVAGRLHGTGFAQQAHAAYEQWARAGGARWLRLGVAEQNQRARRFWQRLDYQPVTVRDGVRMGALNNRLHILVKPLSDTLEAYLQARPADRGGAPAVS